MFFNGSLKKKFLYQSEIQNGHYRRTKKTTRLLEPNHGFR